jgi:hypothetical protein
VGKGPELVGASLQQEEQMTIITRFDTATYTITELRGLFRGLFNQLARLSLDDPDYQITKASMEIVEAELRSRSPSP